MQPIISVENLSKVYPLYADKRDRLFEALDPFRRCRHKDFYALRDVSFTVAKGECVGIVGVNGSGKSTLLKVLTGVLTPTSGKVTVQGRVSALLELGAGFHPERTGMENVYFQGALQGMDKKEVDEYLPKVIEFADIGEFINQPVKIYSSGMFVRLAFAAAIQGNPDILIVDEALSVGDSAFQIKCITHMSQLIEKGTSILFVSHSEGLIKKFCERAIWLNQGVVKDQGISGHIMDRYTAHIRDELISQNISIPQPSPQQARTESEKISAADEDKFKEISKPHRSGVGGVSIYYATLTNENNIEKTNFDFNEKIKLSLYARFDADLTSSFGFKIRNHLAQAICGSSLIIEKVPLITGKAGDIFCIEFETHVPLLQGEYHFQLTSGCYFDITPIHYDIIDFSCPFTVNIRGSNMYYDAIWSYVYLPTKISIISRSS